MLTWSDNYIMGIDQFDQEHQQLFRLADQVIQRMRERSDEGKHAHVCHPGGCDLHQQLF